MKIRQHLWTASNGWSDSGIAPVDVAPQLVLCFGSPDTLRDGALKGSPRSLTQTSDGYLWLGTEFGVLRFDGVQFVEWLPPAGMRLPSPTILKLVASSDGGLWIGTRSGGLCAMQNGRLASYRANDWLSDDSVRAIYEDEDGAVWVGTRSSGL